MVTSFGIFKFMVAYSLTEFLSVIILYSIESNLTDIQFLFIDLCLIINFAFFFGKTRAYKKRLSKTTPMTSLLSFTPLLSLTMLMLMMTIFQTIAYHGVRQFPWYTTFKPTSNTDYTCYENYSVYCVSMFQYITMAIIFSRGKPYRRAIYTNGAFMFSIILLTIVCVYITVYPASWVLRALEMLLPPYEWGLTILILALVNFVICFFIETFIVERLFENVLKKRLYKPEKSKKRYLRIEHELNNSGNWPTISNNLSILSILQRKNKVQDVSNVTCNGNHSSTVSNGQETNDFNTLTKVSSGKHEKINGIDNRSFVSD